MLSALASVISNKSFSSSYGLLTLFNTELVSAAKPGQFVMLTPYRADDPFSSLFLKRPISIYSVNKEESFISFYYQRIGKGTEFFSHLQPGDEISILGPLGRGFRTQGENQKILFVGAGVGTAPFHYLYDALYPKNPDIHMIFGGRDADAVLISNDFPIPKDKMTIVTDDGSVGEKTNVVEVTRKLLSDSSLSFDYMYVCGPTIVLQKTAELAKEYEIPGQLSLEAYMGCGVRACQACSIETKQGIQKICSFGPVFDIQNIIWEKPLC